MDTEPGADGLADSLRDQLIALMRRAIDSGELEVLKGRDLHRYADKIVANASILTWHDSGSVRGFVAVYCNDTSSKIGFVTMLVVDSAYRRKGVASVLLRAAIGALRASGFTSCRLNVDIRNLPAIGLYEGLGFRRIETNEVSACYELVLRDPHQETQS